ncbi:MAG: hypothetical protein SCM11_20540, partial [Bacillota bacterium]|nr:hypothetical protein [Bacillota bacterium]
MIKEKYQVDVAETSFSVVMSRLDSIRKKNVTRTGYRVYQDGLIGIYGQLGQSREDPWTKAIENLGNRVAYPFAPVQNQQKTKIVPSNLDESKILPELEIALEQARKQHPDFILSSKI